MSEFHPDFDPDKIRQERLLLDVLPEPEPTAVPATRQLRPYQQAYVGP
jgi:hypothetical protein